MMSSHETGTYAAFYQPYFAEDLCPNGRGDASVSCPFHDDNKPSMRINVNSGLYKCFACDAQGDAYRFYMETQGADLTMARHAVDEIVALGSSAPPSEGLSTSHGNRPRSRSVVARYDYADEGDVLLFQVERLQPKAFRQRRPDPDNPGRWIYNVEGVRKVLYRLPAVLKAVATGQRVWLVEGERDADRLRDLGIVATTAPMGAGKWRQEYADCLAGASVVILPDNDEPGRAHAEQVARSLASVAREVAKLALPGLPEKGDVSDWLEAGRTREQLERLADAAGECAAQGRPEPEPIGVLLSEVEPRKVFWLWYPWIPLGKLTMLDGDPGLGKSTVALDWTARVSTGRPMPGEGEVGTEPAGVVILTAEDDLGDTVRPRLDAAGADTSRVLALPMVPSGNPDGRPPVLPDDLSFLRLAIERVDAKLVVIDPLVAFLPASIDSHKDQSVRVALWPLAVLAEETGVALLLIRHLNKSVGGNPLYRGGGSIAFIGAARSGLLVAKDPDDETHRVLAPTKCNLALEAASLSFHLEQADNGVARVVWDGPSPHSARQLLSEPVGARGSSDLDDDVAVVEEILADGPVPSKELFPRAQDEGMSKSRAYKALKVLNCVRRKAGMRGGWTWELPNFSNFSVPEGGVSSVSSDADDEAE